MYGVKYNFKKQKLILTKLKIILSVISIKINS